MKHEISGQLLTTMVGAGVYKAFEAYSQVSGVPMVDLVGEALRDFNECSISARMEAIQERCASDAAPLHTNNVVCISEVLCR